MTRSSFDNQELTISYSPLGGDFDVLATAKIISRRATLTDKLIGRAGTNHVPTMPTRAGANVKDIIRFKHHLFIVFNHQNGVAQIAEIFERVDQFNVVALMETNARFIHNIQNPNQLSTNLGRQTNPLGFAPRQRFEGAVKRQVIQTNV